MFCVHLNTKKLNAAEFLCPEMLRYIVGTSLRKQEQKLTITNNGKNKPKQNRTKAQRNIQKYSVKIHSSHRSVLK